MGTSRFPEAQIVGMMKEQEAGLPTSAPCRARGWVGNSGRIRCRLMCWAGAVLVADHGLFAGRDVRGYIARSGIVPDAVVATT